MSGYQRINFKDQNVERPKTYDVTNNPDGSITLIESFGNVEELGTPINQENMNHIEDGIDAVSFSKFSLDLTYKKDDLVTNIQDDELKIFKSLKDNNFAHLPSESDYWEEVEIAGGSGFNLFDTKISDHILEGNEAKGWALQGTWVSGTLYPNFYNKVLEEYYEAKQVTSKITAGSKTINMYIHSNGHNYYNASSYKDKIDDWFNTFGVADFYGVDEENQRVFLPRNKYFQQLTDEVSKVNQMMEAGLPNITGAVSSFWCGGPNGGFSGALYALGSGTQYGGGSSSGSGFGLNASKSSPIYGNSDTVQPPSSLKLLYYCVGNTVINDAEIDAGGLVSEMEKKADVNLSNLSNDAKKLMDGAWVKIPRARIYQATTIGNFTIDLSDYLPNDNYIYEVLLGGLIKSNNSCACDISSSVVASSDETLMFMQSPNGTDNVVRANCIIPIGVDRTLGVHKTGVTPTSFSIYLFGYRRVGTNE